MNRGRQDHLTPEEVADLESMYRAGVSIRRIAARFNISERVAYTRTKKLRVGYVQFGTKMKTTIERPLSKSVVLVPNGSLPPQPPKPREVCTMPSSIRPLTKAELMRGRA